MNQKILVSLIVGAVFAPSFALAGPVISEVMYDLDGTDTGREWLEIWNNGSEAVDLADWRLFEADTNHKLVMAEGNSTLPPNGFAIIADDSQKFLADWPNFSGVIFDSAFSLSNTGETLILRSPDLVDVDSVTYSNGNGGAGDGLSLQKSGNAWSASAPTPGSGLSGNVPPGEPAVTGVGSSGNSGGSSGANDEPPVESSSPSEPKIFVFAGSDRTVTAGSVIAYTASALGVDKKPLASGKFVWTFGDGSYSEGRKVFHSYLSVGNYLAFVEVSSGDFTAKAKIKIKVVPAELVIASVSSGRQGGIVLRNGGNSDADISGWILNANLKRFILPQNTVILAGAEATFPAVITNLDDVSRGVYLSYPSGEVASRYQEPVAQSEPFKEGTVVGTVEPIQKEPVAASLPKIAPVTMVPQAVAFPKVSEPEQVATVKTALDVGSDSEAPSRFPWPWFFGVFGLAILAVSGVWYSSGRFGKPQDEAVLPDTGGYSPSEFDLIEE